MFPACALFYATLRRGYDVSLVTDDRGDVFCNDITAKVVLKTLRFSPGNFPKTVFYLFRVFCKFLKFWLLKRPAVVIGFGGSFTIVPLLTAKILRSKIVIYEQNAVLGRANRFLERFADLKLTSFELGDDWVQAPAPVREDFLQQRPYECAGALRILIIGGSQGAASLLSIIPGAMETLTLTERQDLEIIQQTANGGIDDLKKIYDGLRVKSTLKPFLHCVAEEMLMSQLVICRSGASTLSELAATGRPAILIPYPRAADNHQLHNALSYKNRKAAWVLEEKDGVAVELGQILREILQNRELLKKASFHMMNGSSHRATDRFVELIERI
jgi:UDP-N-acetylglucosamine--N-acetylmuramyl-(pentapeptide) pyrophosphoryl-undecaprenol N-acetylglucosamine transferase